jgi:hypothetical protein
MKTLRLVGLIGLTSIALAHTGLAGGFGGGQHFAPGFSGGRPNFGGSAGRPASHGMRPYRQPAYAGRNGQTAGLSGRPTAPLYHQANQFRSRDDHVRQRSSIVGPSNQRAWIARNHIFARHDGNWHHDWDRHHAHFWNGRWWCFDGGLWLGLDAGFYPWDYSPYYASDYDAGYYADVESGYNDEGPSNSAEPSADPNVAAIQERLATLGYYHEVADGLFGPDTMDALGRYQSDQRLPVTGTLTSETLQSLGVTYAPNR